MKKLIINGVVAAILFGGSLVGGLAATGRLNHEGVANIPLLSSFFPEPTEPATEDGEGSSGQDGAANGDVANATHAGDGAATNATLGEDNQVPQGAEGPRRTKTGKSVINPEPPPDDGHGGGHGTEDPPEEDDKPKPAAATGQAKAESDAQQQHAAERDFRARELAMAQDKTNKYSPGGYFTFSGLPSGVTPEQLNDAWQRVQGVLSDLDQRKTALDHREKELSELADDISRRHLELGRLREELDNDERKLADRITKFQAQVKLVRRDEVAALQRNAKTLESFEAVKAAELVTEQWGTEQGQTEVLKTFEYMNKDKVNEIIQQLANPLIQDVLKKRLLVSKESATSRDGD